MVVLSIPYDRDHLTLELDDAHLAAVLLPPAANDAGSTEEVVRDALANPLSSPALSVLARGKGRVVIITSDHTRPIPSRITIPLLLAELRKGNPGAEVTILVGMGTHRTPNREELVTKFGEEICQREQIVLHRADDPGELREIGILPSGFPLEIHRRAAEADLLVAEGFINPHLFAGFSGGPKSILPGVASYRSVKRNHCGRNIAHPMARIGALTGNPIHQEMEAAADLARLAFILNVVMGSGGRIAAAFAGDWRAAHAEGTRFVAARVGVPAVRAAVTVVSNGGYPLDQNLYQAVKGMATAEATTVRGGHIIIVAACADGVGGDHFGAPMARMSSPAAFCAWAEGIPPDETPSELWSAQILARILRNHQVTLVSSCLPAGTKLPPGMCVRPSLGEAVTEALAQAGAGAKVTVIPDGVTVMPVES